MTVKNKIQILSDITSQGKSKIWTGVDENTGEQAGEEGKGCEKLDEWV